jgi:prepilin signal peptidase PulO-like enzyme (type II secretory pathway)
VIVPWFFYVLLFVGGALLGGQINRGIYRLAWAARPIGPWSAPHPEAPPRRPMDRLPIWGWLGLRRESPLHGQGYWIRPLLIELAAAAGTAAWYGAVVGRAALVPPAAPVPPDPWMLHGQFVATVILFSLMAVATFIDFDEKTIPDAITVPGALAVLVLLAVWPAAGLPAGRLAAGVPAAPRVVNVEPLQLTTPNAWPAWLDGIQGLAIGGACFGGWCLAIWPRTVTWRRGWWKALQYAAVSMFRYPYWWLVLLVMVVGGLGIAAVWWWSGTHWRSLLTALVGLAAGGGLIWAVRIVGGSALGKEAMGFGDVTLMALIGAYVGWQPALLVFFLAPFAAVLISLAQWLLTRRRDIAFGPYLCAGAVVVVVWWGPVWEERVQRIFSLGWLIPQLLFFCLVLLGGMLMLWRLAERGWRRMTGTQ